MDRARAVREPESRAQCAEHQDPVPDPAGHGRRRRGLDAGGRVVQCRAALGEGSDLPLLSGRAAPSGQEGEPEGLPGPHEAVLRSLPDGRTRAAMDDRRCPRHEEGRTDQVSGQGGKREGRATGDPATRPSVVRAERTTAPRRVPRRVRSSSPPSPRTTSRDISVRGGCRRRSVRSRTSCSRAPRCTAGAGPRRG